MIDEAFRAVLAPLADEVRALREEIGQLRRALDARLPEPWLTRQEAAEALGCSVATIDRQIAVGLLQARRIGKRGIRVRILAHSDESVAATARKVRGR